VKKWLRKNYGSIAVFSALALLGLALLLDNQTFANMSTYALVVITAVYTQATVKMVDEMKQTRLDAARPSFSLQPEGFTLDGSFSELFL
jgi:hypothetical protein